MIKLFNKPYKKITMFLFLVLTLIQVISFGMKKRKELFGIVNIAIQNRVYFTPYQTIYFYIIFCTFFDVF